MLWSFAYYKSFCTIPFIYAVWKKFCMLVNLFILENTLNLMLIFYVHISKWYLQQPNKSDAGDYKASVKNKWGTDYTTWLLGWHCHHAKIYSSYQYVYITINLWSLIIKLMFERLPFWTNIGSKGPCHFGEFEMASN